MYTLEYCVIMCLYRNSVYSIYCSYVHVQLNIANVFPNILLLIDLYCVCNFQCVHLSCMCVWSSMYSSLYL